MTNVRDNKAGERNVFECEKWLTSCPPVQISGGGGTPIMLYSEALLIYFTCTGVDCHDCTMYDSGSMMHHCAYEDLNTYACTRKQ